MSTNPHHPLIAVTMGDPAGVGPEVVLRALAEGELTGEAITVLNLDRAPPQEVLRAVEQVGDVSQVRHVTLPEG